MSATTAQAIEELSETVEALRGEVARLRAAYDELAERQEDAEATAWYDRWKASQGAAETLPPALVDRLMNGDSPVAVFREHRGLTRAALAGLAGTTSSVIERVEAGEHPLVPTLRDGLAKALGVTEQDLTD